MLRIEDLLDAGQAAITEPVFYELMVGTRNEKDLLRLKSRFQLLPMLEVNSHVWERAYSLGPELRRNGFTYPMADLLIACAAKVYGAGLVHADSDYDTIARVLGLKAESFVELFRSPGT